MLNHSTSGIGYFLAGVRYLIKPGIKRFVIIPLIINILLFIGMIAFAGYYFNDFLHWLDHALPTWLQWLNWILWPIFAITISIITLYFFNLVANILGAPFNSFLSEKVEYLEIGMVAENSNMLGLVKDMPRTMLREWTKIKYYLPRFLALFILFIIPGVNVVAPWLWFIFSSWSMALQYIDYPMDNHRTSFLEMRKKMQRSRLQNFTFGVAVTIALLIPIINFLVMPAAVIGATLMWIDQERLRKE